MTDVHTPNGIQKVRRARDLPLRDISRAISGTIFRNAGAHSEYAHRSHRLPIIPSRQDRERERESARVLWISKRIILKRLLDCCTAERSRCAAAVIVDLEYSRRKSREQSDQRGDVSTRQTRQSRGKIRPKAERALRSRGRKPDPQTHRRTDGRTDCTTTGATLLALLEKIPKGKAVVRSLENQVMSKL